MSRASHRECAICGKYIVLMPSASDRAKKYGESSKFYLDLFTEHGQCTVDKRNRDVLELIRSQANG